MSRTILNRLCKLEAAQPQRVGRYHQIIIDEGEDPEPHQAALFASGEAQEGDSFIIISIVRPKAREREADQYGLM